MDTIKTTVAVVRANRREIALLCLITLGGLLLRLYFAATQSFTNDEGAYYYDAWLLSRGGIAAGDWYAKAPLAVGIYSLFAKIFGGLYFARIAAVLMSIGTGIAVHALARLYLGKKAAFIAAAVWQFLPAAVFFGVSAETETPMLFFALLYLAFLSYALKGGGKKAAVAAGIFLAAAFLSRKTGVVAAVPALIVSAWAGKAGVKKYLVSLAAAAAVVLSLAAAHAAAFGGRYAADLLGAGFLGVVSLKLSGGGAYAWGGPAAAPLMSFLKLALPTIAAAAAGIWAFFTGRGREAAAPALFWAALAWLVSAAAVYIFWPTLILSYLAELLPPLAILSAYSAEALGEKPAALAAFAALLCAATLGYAVLAYSPPTGMFAPAAVREMSGYIRRSTPKGARIFTAAALIPSLAERRIVLDIAHPMWYELDFVPAETRHRFLPAFPAVMEALAESDYILMDHFTDRAYFYGKEGAEILRSEGFGEIFRAENDTGYRNNPLVLYERRPG